jgi:hypothetical protein
VNWNQDVAIAVRLVHHEPDAAALTYPDAQQVEEVHPLLRRGDDDLGGLNRLVEGLLGGSKRVAGRAQADRVGQR